MALYENSIPILESDTEPVAVFMPEVLTEIKFPKKAVMLFMQDEVDEFVKEQKADIIYIFDCIPRKIPIYRVSYKGSEICFCKTPLGGPAAVQLMELLIAQGVNQIVAAGCCGALIEDKEGAFYYPVKAVRQEGTSYQYLPPSKTVATDSVVIDAIRAAVEEAGYTGKECITWTTDALFRETPDMVNKRRVEGCSVVDMECASMAACASFRHVRFGQLLFTADSLAGEEGHDTRNWAEETFSVALRLAFTAAAKLS